MATNSYMFTAVSVAMGVTPEETFMAVLSITTSMLMGIPLELYKVTSYEWLLVAVFSSSALFACLALILRRVVTLLPLASPTEMVALAVMLPLSYMNYLGFPIIFFSALYCGGDGEGSCMTNEKEAELWIIIESITKVFFYITIVVASMATASCTSIHADIIQRPISMQLRKYYNVPLTWMGVLGDHSWSLLVAPLISGTLIYGLQDVLLALAYSNSSPPDVLGALVSIKYVSYSIAILAALSVFLVSVDNIIRTEDLSSLISSFTPDGFFFHAKNEFTFDISSSSFSMPTILYVDEPHVTVLFAGIVDPVLGIGDVTPSAVQGTLDALFSQFDKLQVAAGVIKIEATGGVYMSVDGASGPVDGPRIVAKDAKTQALRMAHLAMAMIEASRKHKWPTGEQLQVRIGMHCGPATSGVLGGILSRWAVFGQTVLVASRMEYTGEALQVHVTQTFAHALREGNSARAFSLVDHTLDVQGIGKMNTFFLRSSFHEHRH